MTIIKHKMSNYFNFQIRIYLVYKMRIKLVQVYNNQIVLKFVKSTGEFMKLKCKLLVQLPY